MRHPWPEMPLREVLVPVGRAEVPKPGTMYRQIGVKLWGVGAYEREPMDGGHTRYSQLFRAEADDTIVNKIWARNGSVAVVPTSLAGCYASGEFPMFVATRDRLEPRWIHWLTKTPTFWGRCDEKSQGTSGKNRIRPERFLEIEIPVPCLAEQRRIVARIEELAARVNQAGVLRRQATDEVQALLAGARCTLICGSDSQIIAPEDGCSAIIDNLHSNPRLSEAGVPCVRSPDVGYGTLDLDGAQRTDEDEYRRRTVRGEPQPDDIVLVREGGGTGKCALVSPGQRFSLGQRVMMLRPDRDRVLPRFFLHQLLSPLVQEAQIAPLCKGSASPHLNIGSLRRFKLRVPPLPDQRRIAGQLDALQREMDALKRLHAQTVAELDALLPAVLDKGFTGEL